MYRLKLKFLLAKTFCRLLYLLFIMFLYYNFRNVTFLALEPLQLFEKSIFAGIVAVRKLYSNLPPNVTNLFTKEASLFRRIS